LPWNFFLFAALREVAAAGPFFFSAGFWENYFFNVKFTACLFDGARATLLYGEVRSGSHIFNEQPI
jgi:hypothetical protein